MELPYITNLETPSVLLPLTLTILLADTAYTFLSQCILIRFRMAV